MRHGWVFIFAILIGVLSGCSVGAQPCRVQSEQFMSDSEAVFEKWSDAFQLANSTPRASLSTAISDLQTIKREADDLEVPECAVRIRTALVNGMQSTIDGFIAFLASDSEESVNQSFELAAQYFAEYTVRLDRLNKDEDVNAPLPTPRPTQTRAPTRTPPPTHTRVPTPTTIAVNVGEGVANATTVRIPTTLRVMYLNGPNLVRVFDEPNGVPLSYCELPVNALVEAVEVDDSKKFIRIEGSNCNGWVRVENLKEP